jgi:hypothetical protein
MAPTPSAGMSAHHECEQCQILRELYRETLVEEARLESVSVTAPEMAQNLAGLLEVAERFRRAARDALIAHQIERGHGAGLLMFDRRPANSATFGSVP